jgi:hypothetical protein
MESRNSGSQRQISKGLTMSILVLTSDTLIGTPAAGNIEYSSPIFTGTPIGTQRGIVPTQQYYRLNSALAGANVNTAQSIFGVGVTLSSSTVYEFEMMVAYSKSAGTTAHTFSMGFGGTATVNNIAYEAITKTNVTSFTNLATSDTVQSFIQTASATALTGSITSAAQYLLHLMKGTVSVNAGGTFIPQYTLSAAPGGAYTTAAGSFIRIAPLSASGANTSVGAWA